MGPECLPVGELRGELDRIDLAGVSDKSDFKPAALTLSRADRPAASNLFLSGVENRVVGAGGNSVSIATGVECHAAGNRRGHGAAQRHAGDSDNISRAISCDRGGRGCGAATEGDTASREIGDGFAKDDSEMDGRGDGWIGLAGGLVDRDGRGSAIQLQSADIHRAADDARETALVDRDAAWNERVAARVNGRAAHQQSIVLVGPPLLARAPNSGDCPVMLFVPARLTQAVA